MSRTCLLFICTGIVIALPSCAKNSPEPKDELPAAATETAQSKPYAMPGLDHGLVQSPVNILTSAVEGGHHEVAINLHHADPEYLENKGHTIQLDFPEGSSVRFDGRDYSLKQLHFHTPSEHQIDGVTFPMEVHVVNMIEPKTPEDPPRYLVMSFLYKMGAEDTFITSFLDHVPKEEGSEELEPGTVELLRRSDLEYEYYHYRGSLTTPPYTETVEWLS